jgi:hypothetical protein
MPAISRFVMAAELATLTAERRRSLLAQRQLTPIRRNQIHDPELSLWRLCTQAVSHKFAFMDLFTLVVLLAVCLAGTIGCFTELSYLLKSDAVSRLVVTAATGGG